MGSAGWGCAKGAVVSGFSEANIPVGLSAVFRIFSIEFQRTTACLQATEAKFCFINEQERQMWFGLLG